MNDLTILSGQGITALKESLTAITPTKATAVKWLNLRSLITSKAGEAKTKELVAHLKECKDCEEFEADGLKVKLVTRKMRVYKETKETKAAAKALQVLKDQRDQIDIDIELAEAELQHAQDKAGFLGEETDMDKSYYKAI